MVKAVQRLVHIEADASGNPPTAIHLLSIGHWHTPWHGAFEHTAEDLAAMVTNFQGGVGLVANPKKPGVFEAPINYDHEHRKAAAWITDLFTENNGTELWGHTRWTKAGAQALRDEEYKYISPEWNPRDWPWEDPEQEGVYVDNVLTAAALTNEPLFKKLQPIMASAHGPDGVKVNNEGGDMDLATILAKKADERTDDEKAFVLEHKAELTAEQLEAEGLTADETDEQKAAREAAEKEAANKAAADAKAAEDTKRKEASALHGYTPEKLAKLEADAKAGREAQQELLRTRLEASVREHIARGAIKSDQSEAAVQILMASSDSQREKVQEFMKALPDNKILASTGARTEEADIASFDVTEEEKRMAADFNLTVDQIAEYKKSLNQ